MKKINMQLAVYLVYIVLYFYYHIFVGIVNCGINFHLLLHLPFYVRKFGPLWTHSAFPFESQMNNFLKNSHATHGIPKQVNNCLSNYIIYIYMCVYETYIWSCVCSYLFAKISYIRKKLMRQKSLVGYSIASYNQIEMQFQLFDHI